MERPSRANWLERLDGRLVEEFRRSRESHPKLASLYALIVRHRLWVIVGLALVRGVWDGLEPPLFDFERFSLGADRMLSTDWALTYSERKLQAGPLLLLIYGVAVRLQDLAGLNASFSLSIVVQVLIAVGVVRCVRLLRHNCGVSAAPGLELFAGLAALLGGITWEAYASAHPSEALIPLLWLPAAVLARRRRVGTAATLIALSASLKLWGILGLPLLLLAPTVTQALPALLLGVLLSFVTYAPFVVFGDTTTFEFSWGIESDSPIGLLFRNREPFTWPMRVAQSAVILGAGALFARRRRSSWRNVWAAPLVLLAVRFLTDPLDYHYYWLAPAVVLLISACVHLDPAPSWLRLPIGASFYGVLVTFFVVDRAVEAVWWIALSLALIGFAERATREPSTSIGSMPATPLGRFI